MRIFNDTHGVRRFLEFAGRSGAIAMGIALFACGSAAKNAALEDPAIHWIGNVAPDIKLKTLDGADAALADYRGKIVVLHFGASW